MQSVDIRYILVPIAPHPKGRVSDGTVFFTKEGGKDMATDENGNVIESTDPEPATEPDPEPATEPDPEPDKEPGENAILEALSRLDTAITAIAENMTAIANRLEALEFMRIESGAEVVETGDGEIDEVDEDPEPVSIDELDLTI